MQTIEFDSGIQQYRLGGGGVLRFNPADPNVYARFLEAEEKLRALEEELTAQAETADANAALRLMQEADRRMKEVLSWIFGAGNDFETILGGINLLAVAGNGERLVTNLLAALEPILTEGARRFARERAAQLRAETQ